MSLDIKSDAGVLARQHSMEQQLEIDPEAKKESVAPKPSADADESVKKIDEDVVKEVKQDVQPVKVPFNAGLRTTPPAIYKETVKTVPTPVTEFVVNELKKPQEPKSSVSVLSNKSINRPRPQQPIKPKEPPRILFKDLKVRPLPDDKCKVVFVAGDPESKIFSICENNSDVQDYMMYIENTIAQYVEKNEKSGYKPQVGEMVLAKFEDKFYRGVCQEQDTDGFNIYYIDYGNRSVVQEDQIKVFDKKLMFEVVIHECYMENFPNPMTDEAGDVLAAEGGVSIINIKKDPQSGIYSARIKGL